MGISICCRDGSHDTAVAVVAVVAGGDERSHHPTLHREVVEDKVSIA